MTTQKIVDGEKQAKKYFDLVEALKKVLLTGQISFLKAGFCLWQIKKDKLYKFEDSSREVTFEEFCNKPEIPLPHLGANPKSAVNMAEKLIRIYKVFIEQLKEEETELAEIGQTKLDILAPLILKGKINFKDWKEQARVMSVRELKETLLQKDMSMEEIINCPHPAEELEEVKFWHCKRCHRTMRDNPHIKAGEVVVKKVPNEDINYLTELLKKEIDIKKLDESEKQNRRYAWLCLKKFGVKGTEMAIRIGAKDKFYSGKMTSFRWLYYNVVQIVNSYRKKQNNVVKL